MAAIPVTVVAVAVAVILQDTNDCGGDVEAAVSIGGVFGVPEDRLFKVVCEHHSAILRDKHTDFEMSSASTVQSRAVIGIFDEVERVQCILLVAIMGNV